MFRLHTALQAFIDRVGAPAGIAMNHVFGGAMPYVCFWLVSASGSQLRR
jgi:hypothetical protein